jgi:hypothetical protein
MLLKIVFITLFNRNKKGSNNTNIEQQKKSLLSSSITQTNSIKIKFLLILTKLTEKIKANSCDIISLYATMEINKSIWL